MDTPETLRDGRYVVVGVLGSGSQGETLDAVDKKNGRPVAIKRFFVRGAKSWKDVELAEREARVLSGITYRSFPAYLDHFEERGALCLVMEKIEGESLAVLRKRGGRLAQPDVIRLLNEAADGLDYLHTRAPPIIHRDLKPGNVIRRLDGSFAFVDFGSVRDTLKPEGGSTVVGTFGYMAPEQFQGRAGAGSDIYAIGATALALLTGSEPEDLPHRGLGIDVSAALGSSSDPRLVRALSAMLEPDPDKRPKRLRELLDRTGLGLASQSSSFPEPPREKPRAARPRHPHQGAEEWARDFERQAEEWARNAEQQAEEWARRAEQQAEQWGRRSERRARRHARRWDERAYRHHMRGRAFRNPLFVAIILLGLGFARVGNMMLFRFLLPMLLTVLSVFFGPALRRASQRCAEIGETGERGLVFASDVIRSRFTGAEPPPPPKVRVEERGPIRVEEVLPEDEIEIEQEEEREARRSRR